MSRSIKFKWFLLTVVALFLATSPVVSWASDLEDAQEAVRQNPNDAGAHHGLGLAYLIRGRNNEAIASYKEGIRIKPDNATAHHGLGLAYLMLGRNNEAIAEYKEAIRIKPDYADAHYGVGYVYNNLAQHQDAIAPFKEAIRIYRHAQGKTPPPILPTFAYSHYGLGLAYEKLGRNDEAIAEYKEALRIDPHQNFARSRLLELGQKTVGTNLSEVANEDSALSEVKSKYIKKVYAKVYSNWKTPLGSIKKNVVVSFTIFSKGNINNPVIRKSTGDKNLDSIAVRAVLDSVPFTSLPQELNRPNLTINIDFKYVSEQDRKVIDSLKQAIQDDPSSAKSHYALGLKYYDSSKYKEALDSFTKANEIDPNTYTHHALGLTYLNLGRKQNAIDSFKEAISILPDNFYAHRDLGLTYHQLGQHQNAVDSYREAIHINPDDLDTRTVIGHSYLILGNNKEAIVQLKKALELDPNNFSSNINYAMAHANLDKHAVAIIFFEAAVRIKPDSFHAQNALGFGYLELEKFQKSIGPLKKAIQLISSISGSLRTDFLDPHYLLGYAYDNLDQYEEAISSYKKAISLNPNTDSAHEKLGEIYMWQGKMNTALISLIEADRIHPNDPHILSDLGIVYSQLEKPKKAMEVLERALANNPDSQSLLQEIYGNLSEVYESLKRYDDAIATAKKTLEIEYDDAMSNYILGLSYDAKEDGLKAITHMLVATKNFRIDSKGLEKNDRWAKRTYRTYLAKSNKTLREFYQKYNYRPEDFGEPQIATAPKIITPASPSTPQPQQKQKPVPSIYSGTGFLFSAKDYIITNWHVVRGTKNIRVKFLNGESIRATLVLKDSQNDIAFLKLERPPEIPSSNLKIGDSSKVSMGDKVFTIGYPAHWVMGKNPKYTEGVVNAVSGLQDDPTVFQISVQIQPGNSGGPLFNTNGEVVGITTATLDPGFAVEKFRALPQNVNYAIKSNYISTLLPMLPETMLASRGIVVIPAEPEHTLSNFIKKVKKNIVLIEARE